MATIADKISFFLGMKEPRLVSIGVNWDAKKSQDTKHKVVALFADRPIMPFKIIRSAMAVHIRSGLIPLGLLLALYMTLFPTLSVIMALSVCIPITLVAMVDAREYLIKDQHLWLSWQGRPAKKVMSLHEISSAQEFKLGRENAAHLVITTKAQKKHFIYFVDNAQEALALLRPENQDRA